MKIQQITNNDDNKNLSEKPNKRFYLESIFKLLTVIIVCFTVLFGLKIVCNTPSKVISTGGDQLNKLSEKINQILSSRQNFESALGSIVSEQRVRKLQFFQRNQVGLFRIIRYIGTDKKEHNHTEFYRKESDKKPLCELPILLNQYSEFLAKTVFEFNFYINLENLSEWDYYWDKENFQLILYPPDITVGTPAELEPIVFIKLADCVSLDESKTKEALARAINFELKQKLAEDQKKFLYEEARLAVKDLFIQFFRFKNIERIPEIIVVFPHEKEQKEKKDGIIHQKL